MSGRRSLSLTGLLATACVALLALIAVKEAPGDDVSGLATLRVAQLDGDAAPEPPPAEPEFGWVRVIIDSKHQALAAYQVVLRGPESGVRIVGIGGGTHPVLRDPPKYDPKAMQNNWVIMAWYSLLDVTALPGGRNRIATVHYMVDPDALKPVRFTAELEVAAGPDGEPIPAEVFLKHYDQ